MDRPPPGPGTDGESHSGRYTGAADRSRSPGHPLPDSGEERTEHRGGFGPLPPASPGPTPGYGADAPADPMPTVPIPRLPDVGSHHPTEPEPLPPKRAGYSTPSPEPGTPDRFSSPTAEHPPNARYEGNWADWMMSSDGYPPRPGGEPAESYATDTGSAPWDDGQPADDVPAEKPDGSVANAPEPDATAAPATARERLRARLTPREVPAPLPVTAHTSRTPGRTRLLPVLLGVAGVAALGTAAYVQFAVVGAGESSTAANPPTSRAPEVPPAADPNCPAERIGNTVQGNGPGGTGSGTDAIFGFQHAYYVTRSGEQTRTVVAPDAAVPPAADIQHGIDTIPAGTTHCIQITPGAFVGQYTVVVTEHRPGSAPLGYNPQLVTTMRIGDRTLITGIGPMP